MQTIEKYFEMIFKAETAKQAYLKACKWLATNIISKDELSETTWKTKKIEETATHASFKLELYCMLDDQEIAERFCTTCHDMHKSFFINEEYNCSRCNMITFRKRLKESLDVKKTYRKQKIIFNLNK